MTKPLRPKPIMREFDSWKAYQEDSPGRNVQWWIEDYFMTERTAPIRLPASYGRIEAYELGHIRINSQNHFRAYHCLARSV